MQYWNTAEPRGHDLARAAVAQGARLVMSPGDQVYLDMKYDESTPLGQDWAGHVEVRDSYDWDPATLVEGVGEDAILGVEAPLWSETLRTMRDVETMLFPRLCAVAEVAWTPQARRDWDGFRARLAAQAPRWDAARRGVHALAAGRLALSRADRRSGRGGPDARRDRPVRVRRMGGAPPLANGGH